MNKQEIVVLLAAISKFQYVAADEVAVEMWSAALDREVPAEFALQSVATWYSREAPGTLLPGTINREWRVARDRKRNAALAAGAADSHCGRSTCTCPHSQPCYRGWLEGSTDRAVPCPGCRSQVADALATKARAVGSRVN